MDYQEFLSRKVVSDAPSGFACNSISEKLYPFQRDIVRWALRRGRAAILADCGLGKTAMQLEWARHVCEETGGNVLVVAPLAVGKQTEREGTKFGIEATYRRAPVDTKGITITNYEMIEHFEPSAFAGVVLDESSILKSYMGKFRNYIIDKWGTVPYRLACTATPAPNDYMELGNHSEFLGVMKRVEMLALFFTHDGGDTAKWRLKGHGASDFWKWICSWALMLRMPSDLGYENNGFVLPPINFKDHIVYENKPTEGFLFPLEAQTLGERQAARRTSVEERATVAAELANNSSEPWIMWCDLNKESEEITAKIPGAVEVRGSDSIEHKEKTAQDFATGKIRVLVSKPSIFGFGLNFQRCNNMAFVGLSDSYEQFYQAFRRCWRFGQKNPVNVHIITASSEGAVLQNIRRKEEAAAYLAKEMVENMKEISMGELKGTQRTKAEYSTDTHSGTRFVMHLGDCIERIREMEDESVGFTLFSPPFASLYTYSNSHRDMGNCKDPKAFAEHFQYLIPELLRVTKPGRNLSFHCMNLPISKEREGFIGIRDFRGDLIRSFVEAGWIYHSEVTIWKDPVTAMQRTKALGLLHKQLKKDACMSRQGIPDYLVTMRKPGENREPVVNTNESFPVSRWQEWASPVWMDIKASKTLQRLSCRDDEDERHICPLQLDVIERAVSLWTNPNDIVFSPFAGIGSEGFGAIQLGRRFVGIELKKTYFEQAVKNLVAAESMEHSQLDLFATKETCDDPE